MTEEPLTSDGRLVEDALVSRISVVTGSPVVGLRDILHVLTHPDVITFTEEYVASQKEMMA